jgi:hypothetical protein
MFIPIGGIFAFGGCYSRGCLVNRTIMGLFNLVMGTISLSFGYAQDLTFLIVIGYIIAIMGLLMVLANLFALLFRRQPPRT